jgi:hypothetical protein
MKINVSTDQVALCWIIKQELRELAVTTTTTTGKIEIPLIP